MMMHTWKIRLMFRDARGLFEAGADTGLPVTMSIVEAIQEVARWRSVDLAICTSIEASIIGTPWEGGDPA